MVDHSVRGCCVRVVKEAVPTDVRELVLVDGGVAGGKLDEAMHRKANETVGKELGEETILLQNQFVYAS